MSTSPTTPADDTKRDSYNEKEDEKHDVVGGRGNVQVVKEMDVANAALASATTGTQAISFWSPNRCRLYACCLVIYLCSTMNGFDGSLMGSINALPNYTNYYHYPENGSSGTGIVFSIFNIGQMVGAPFIWLADWKGRRLPIFIGTVGICVGTIVTATATTRGAFIGGRFLLSFFSTIATMASPLLLVELAPPLYRSTVAGMYNTLYYMGSIIATFAVYGAHLHLEGHGLLDFRLPLWLQMVCPGTVAVLIWFIVPESPRWLIAVGRDDEARAFITKYHADGQPDHPLVALEMEEMKASIVEGGGLLTWKNIFDIRVLFKSRSRRYRLGINMAFSWFGQFSGNNVASYYLPLLVENVGITSTNSKLLLNAMYAVEGWIAAAAGALLHDVVGRRKMFLWTTLGMAVCLAITAGTAADYVHTGSQPGSKASIAFIFIFGAVFAIGFTAMQPLYPAEVLSNDMRAKGMAVFSITSGCAGFVNTFAAPTALKNIGYWFYVFFVFWDLFEFLVIYFFFVETKGRTLEELDAVFEASNPMKASITKEHVKEIVVVDQKTGHEVDKVVAADEV